jgi:rfaE bifunctional protein kinase chain/domain
MFKELEIFKGLTKERLIEILENIKNIKVGFIGDLCIDIYWIADMTKSELSRETPHFPLPIVEERFQLGAGGNVIANLASLKPKDIIAVGVIGDDWRGDLVSKCINSLDISMDNVVVLSGKTTNAYCKPIKKGISQTTYEDPRIDFTSEQVTAEVEKCIIEKLLKMAEDVKVICVSDQFDNGCITEKVRDVINQLASSGITIIVDSRDRIIKYKNVILKPNEVESVKAAAMLSGCSEQQFIEQDLVGYVEAAKVIKEKLGCDISMTLGSRGNIQFGNNKAVHILPRDVDAPLDICGAGDTFLSAYSCAVAAGASREEAGQIAAIASEITIGKVGQTGTATSVEVVSRFEKIYL